MRENTDQNNFEYGRFLRSDKGVVFGPKQRFPYMRRFGRWEWTKSRANIWRNFLPTKYFNRQTSCVCVYLDGCVVGGGP